jgi:hypothetical protein
MAILQASQQQYRYSLQPGESLSVVTDANSTCRYGQLASSPASPDVPAGGMITVAASSAITLGPRSDISRWLIDSVVGPGVNVTQNAAAAVADSGAPADLMHLYGAGVPSGATGANQAAPGSLYTDTTNAQLYLQGGTKASPVWKLLTRAA